MPPVLACSKPLLDGHSAASLSNPTARGVPRALALYCPLRVASCLAGLL